MDIKVINVQQQKEEKEVSKSSKDIFYSVPIPFTESSLKTHKDPVIEKQKLQQIKFSSQINNNSNNNIKLCQDCKKWPCVECLNNRCRSCCFVYCINYKNNCSFHQFLNNNSSNDNSPNNISLNNNNGQNNSSNIVNNHIFNNNRINKIGLNNNSNANSNNDNMNIKKDGSHSCVKRWSTEDDIKLMQIVNQNGTKSWDFISSNFKDKSSIECRARWSVLSYDNNKAINNSKSKRKHSQSNNTISNSPLNNSKNKYIKITNCSKNNTLDNIIELDSINNSNNINTTTTLSENNNNTLNNNNNNLSNSNNYNNNSTNNSATYSTTTTTTTATPNIKNGSNSILVDHSNEEFLVESLNQSSSNNNNNNNNIININKTSIAQNDFHGFATPTIELSSPTKSSESDSLINKKKLILEMPKNQRTPALIKLYIENSIQILQKIEDVKVKIMYIKEKLNESSNLHDQVKYTNYQNKIKDYSEKYQKLLNSYHHCADKVRQLKLELELEMKKLNINQNVRNSNICNNNNSGNSNNSNSCDNKNKNNSNYNNTINICNKSPKTEDIIVDIDINNREYIKPFQLEEILDNSLTPFHQNQTMNFKIPTISSQDFDRNAEIQFLQFVQNTYRSQIEYLQQLDESFTTQIKYLQNKN